MTLDDELTAQLAALESRALMRARRTVDGPPGVEVRVDGQQLVNFSSNDYLGLARHPSLVQRAHEWAVTHGVGAQSSRLVCGHFEIHEKIESKIARAKGTEAALLMSRPCLQHSILAIWRVRHSMCLKWSRFLRTARFSSSPNWW